MSDDFLIDSYDLDLFTFTKPKKINNVMVCKIKNDNKDVFVQFPKMSVVSEFEDKYIELEFKNDKNYNKKIYNFLTKLDDLIIEYIIKNSEDWFGKKIPLTNLTQMYNRFIKPAKTCDSNCTLHFVYNKDKSEVLDKRNEKIDITEVKIGNTLECISQMKYIIFSKDSCYVTWEVCTAKLIKRVLRVPKFGFIEDKEDFMNEEPEEEDIIHFF